MLKILQERLVLLLKRFHDFCVKHNLRYYVVGGTCLGAVRHEGFIPWDDDIDVGMPRKDYNRLLELVKEEKIGENCIVEAPLENKDYIYAFAKMYDTTTTLVENTVNKLIRGVYIDIFPLDGCGDSISEVEKHFKKIDIQVNILRAKVCAINKKRKFYKNFIIALFRLLPISKRKIVSRIIRLSEGKDFDQCIYVGNFVGGWHFKEVVKREWFGEPKLYKFEDIQVYGPNNADAYLSNVYGDYMKLPPRGKEIFSSRFHSFGF